MPFQWYLFFKDAYVLLNPLWPCLSCARIRRQSLRMSGTTAGVYNSPLSTSFRFKMLFSIMYVFWSRFLFSHCFLSCLVCGSLSCNLASLSSFRGRWISVFISIGSVCWMFMLPISHLSLLLIPVLLPVAVLRTENIQTLCLPPLVGV